MTKSKVFALIAALVLICGLLYAGPSIFSVYQGGTGNSSLTAHAVLIGQGASPILGASPGTITNCLMSNGPSTDPTFQPCPAGGSASGVRSVAQNSLFANNVSLAASFPLQVKSGDTLFAACGQWTSAANTLLGVFDALGNTFTLVDSVQNTSNFDSELWVYKTSAATSGADMVTCAFSAGGSEHIEIGVLDYSSSLTVDTHTHGTVNATTGGNSLSMTTTATDTLIAFVFSISTGTGGVDVYSGLSGYSREVATGYVSGNTFGIFDKISVSSGAQSVTITGTQVGSAQLAVWAGVH